MFYAIENGKTRAVGMDAVKPGGVYAVFATLGEARALLPRYNLPEKPLMGALPNRAMSFESHEGFDFLCLNALSTDSPAAAPDKVCVYLTGDLLLFAGSRIASTEDMLRSGLADKNLSLTLERLLTLFLERLTAGDTERLEDIEQEIADLENALLTSGKRNAVREIISLRQRLMAFKRHYEQLISVLDLLSENENRLLSRNALRSLKIIAGRADRLYHSVLNLRDYVTQVRESYQAEVDIGLNNIMKIFTVITAIFLPLSLIVGWYGMNFKMPEYGWRFGYLGVIVLSVAVVIFCLISFKKRKWF